MWTRLTRNNKRQETKLAQSEIHERNRQKDVERQEIYREEEAGERESE